VTEAALAKRFYLAFREHDWSALRSCLADDAELGMSGRSAMARTYSGADEAVGVLREIVEHSGGTFRPALDDGWDVCVSEYHAIVLDWFRAERDGRELQAYLYFVMAMKDEKIVRVFVHSSEQYEFDEFFADGEPPRA
jgi:ketosteroid isomerase-like protein